MDNRPKRVVAATPAMAAELASRLSPDHAREILDVSGLTPGPALALSLAASREAYAYMPSGEKRPAFMMGVEDKSPLTGAALLWMLGADGAEGRAAALLRAARWGVGRAFRVTGAERLEQFIPDWYGPGLRFARRLGFVPTPCGLTCRGGAPLWNVILFRR